MTAVSLRARALRLLALREHSRAELQRKLAPYAPDADALRALLDECAQRGWLDADRFAASLVHRRGGRFGAARITQELRSHGIDDEGIARALAGAEGDADEAARALRALRRRHPEPAADLKSYARQQRFLRARGFAADAVRAALKAHNTGAALADDDTDA